MIFFSFKKPKHDEENGDKEGSWKPPSGVNTTSVGQLANVLKQGIPTQLKSTKVCTCMYMYMYIHVYVHVHVYTCTCTSHTHTWNSNTTKSTKVHVCTCTYKYRDGELSTLN